MDFRRFSKSLESISLILFLGPIRPPTGGDSESVIEYDRDSLLPASQLCGTIGISPSIIENERDFLRSRTN